MKKQLLLFALIFTCFTVSAQSTRWTGLINSDWTNLLNWTNGVPTSDSEVEINFINPLLSEPILSGNVTIKKLELGSNGQTLTIANGGVLEITGTLSLGNTATLDIGDGDVIINENSTINGVINIDDGNLQFKEGVTLANADLNVISGEVTIGETGSSLVNFNMSGTSDFSLNTSNLSIYGSINLLGYSDFDAGTGVISITEDANFAGNSSFDLNQGQIEIFGSTIFNSYFTASNGSLIFHDDITFYWGSFDAGESNTVLDGDITIGNNGTGKSGSTGSFYDVLITSGSIVVGDLPLTITGDFDNQGAYSHLAGTTIDIYGDVIGYENMNTDSPFVTYVNATTDTTIEVAFSEALSVASIANIANNTSIRSSSFTNSISSPLMSATLKTGTNNILIFTFNRSIDLTSNSNYLWIYGSVEDVSGNSIQNPYIKEIKEVRDIYWSGNNNSSWTNISNWVDNTGILRGSFPDPSEGYNLYFDENAVNDLVLPQDIVVNSYKNTSTKNLNLNGYTISVSEDINVINSKIIADGLASKLILNGEKKQIIPADIFLNNTIDNLTIANTGEGVLLEGDLNLTGILRLSNGVFDTQDHLTFKSDLNKTAIVAPITNGSILGNVTVERYMPARRAFRFVTSSVNTSTSIHDNWQEGVNNTGITDADNLNPNPGFGTHITGSTIGANGLDATPSGNPSLYKFDNASQNWTTITNTLTENLEAGVPYRMLIRGDRSIDVTSNSTTPQPTILKAVGELATGFFIYDQMEATAGTFELIGNPYQAAVDVQQLLQNSGGINKQFFYVWDPTQNTRGAFVTIDANLNSSNMSSSTANKYLQPWQAAFVEVNGSSSYPYINFTEELKRETTVTTTTYSVTDDNTYKLQVSLFEADAYQNGEAAADGFIVNFSDQFSNNVDDYDAVKFYNLDEMLAISNSDNLLSIENRALVETGDEIEFFNATYRNTNYVYLIDVPVFNGFVGYLYDSYLDKYTALKPGVENFVSFQVDASVDESVASNRFKIVFEEETLGTEDYLINNDLSLYPNPTSEGYVNISIADTNISKDLTVRVYSLLGQQVYEAKETFEEGKLTLPTSNFSSGVYLVKVENENNSYTKKLVVE